MRFLSAIGAMLLLAACATTNEMPLSANMVRLDTHASGFLFVGSASQLTMKRAAEATLQRGYTKFRLQQATMGQGSRMVGLQAHSVGSNALYASPVTAPKADVGVTVVMYHDGDAGSAGAFDAATVLANGGKV